MGVCPSRHGRQDQQLARAAEFARFASQGDVSGLRLMLKTRRVDVNAQDRFGMTALHWAAYAGKLACVQELVAAGASAAVVDTNRRTALHHACRRDHEDVVRFLLESVRMDVDAASENKDTPLHKAVRGRCVRTVVVLLKHGADPRLRNDQNRTPLEELDTAADAGGGKDRSGDGDGDGDRGAGHAPSAWLQPPPGGSAASGRGHLVGLLRRGSGGAELTLVQRLLPNRRSVSELSDDGGGLSSRVSGLWARDADALRQRTASGALAAVQPLDLAALRTTSARGPVSGLLATPSSVSSVTSAVVEPRTSLKYAGKRVIMALRVKKSLPGDEKREMIRLLLLKYSVPAAAVVGDPADPKPRSARDRPPDRSPSPQVSGVKISIAPDA